MSPKVVAKKLTSCNATRCSARVLLLGIVLGVAVITSACLYIPAETKVTLGEPINDEQMARLVPGTTTRAEVIEQLGSPTHELERERVMAYFWDTSSGTFIILVRLTTPNQKNVSRYALMIQFDESGLIRRLERVRRPDYPRYDDILAEWVRKGGNKTSGQ